MRGRRGNQGTRTIEERETFDEYLVRTGNTLSHFGPYARREALEEYHREAQEAVVRHREEFRRLVDNDYFEDVQGVMDRLGPVRRESLVAAKPAFQPIERMRSLGELWLWLGVSVQMKSGRKSLWPMDRDSAVEGIASAADQLRSAIRRHIPFLEHSGPFKDSLDDLERAHARLLPFCPPRPKGKPRSTWRHQAMHLLRHEGGVTRAEAEDLVRAAGLNTDYPEERRPRAAKPRVSNTSRK